ncbi:MAG: zinc-ribbon domain-containing protein, partial [Clostridiales bacterium]|nr:zinc-ribbon domain-containing protein [Clostridiales bacterium]
MHKCRVCGTEFEGKFCPVCGTHYAGRWRCPKCSTVMPAGTRFCPECGTELNMPGFRPAAVQTNYSASEERESSSPSTKFQALRFVPAALLVLLSALLFALFLAPVIEANGLFISGSENVYKVLGDASLKDLHGTLYALIAFAGLGLVVGASIIFVKRKNEESALFDAIAFIFYAVIIALAVLLIFKVKDLDKQISEGLGLLTAGSCPTLIIAFAGACALIGAISAIVRKITAESDSEGESERKGKHVKLAVSLSLLAVVAVVLCSLIPTFKLMTVNGTYYASYGGELSKEKFVTLSTGKWTDEDGNTGTYKVDGKAVILYSTDSLTGLQLSLNGAVNNGVLTVGDTTHYEIYVKESHK